MTWLEIILITTNLLLVYPALMGFGWMNYCVKRARDEDIQDYLRRRP